MSKKEPKPKKPRKPKKNQVVENKGITGGGTDYNIYILSFNQKFLAVVVGFLIGYAAAYIYFNNSTVGMIVGLIAGYKAISIYQNKLFNDRKKELRLQFRDFLESLSNSYTVGKNAINAFESAYTDMVAEHGKDAYITQEVQLICTAYRNQGIEIKDLLTDFAQRSGIDDILSFSGVFAVSTELGGDVGKAVREARDMINDKVEIELEIQTMVTGQKNQLNILAIMPIVMSLLTRTFESDSTSTAVIAVKISALVLFVLAYWIGTKIVDIKV
ncbi:MAG: hypothetical protein K2H29_08600 [Oscillospiraceae bacterium]|nr:hypothetical protein [Oscillospiraceae bacterium]